MPIRRNLAPNPACGTDATGWSSTPAGYARSTSVDASLPRATGYEGSVGADVFTPRAQLGAGQDYVWSVSVKAIAALSANMVVNYYNAPSGGTYLGNSGATVPLNLAAGAVGRFTLGPYTTPAGCQSGLLKLNDLDGACEITAYRCSPSTGDLARDSAYFDGATTGAQWDGTANSSTSTWRIVEEGIGFSESWSKSATAGGPVGADSFAFGEQFTIAASGQVSDQFSFTDGFLIASLAYDGDRGRITVDAFTFAAVVTQARVRRRRVAGGQWEDVRGGTVAVVSGLLARAVEDYEFPAGVPIEYRIEGLTDGGQVAQAATVRTTAAAGEVWLKFIANPALNRPIVLINDPWQIERESRTGLFDVQNRSDPIVVSDVHSSRRVSIRIKAEDQAEADALDAALSLGIPCYLQVPPEVPLPTMYASIGSYRMSRPTWQSRRWIFEVPLTEVAAPPAAVTGAFATWSTVLARYTTWEQVAAEVGSWRELAA